MFVSAQCSANHVPISFCSLTCCLSRQVTLDCALTLKGLLGIFSRTQMERGARYTWERLKETLSTSGAQCLKQSGAGRPGSES